MAERWHLQMNMLAFRVGLFSGQCSLCGARSSVWSECHFAEVGNRTSLGHRCGLSPRIHVAGLLCCCLLTGRLRTDYPFRDFYESHHVQIYSVVSVCAESTEG